MQSCIFGQLLLIDLNTCWAGLALWSLAFTIVNRFVAPTAFFYGKFVFLEFETVFPAKNVKPCSQLTQLGEAYSGPRIVTTRTNADTTPMRIPWTWG